MPHGAAAGFIDVDTHYESVVGFKPVLYVDTVDSPAAFTMEISSSLGTVRSFAALRKTGARLVRRIDLR